MDPILLHSSHDRANPAYILGSKGNPTDLLYSSEWEETFHSTSPLKSKMYVSTQIDSTPSKRSVRTAPIHMVTPAKLTGNGGTATPLSAQIIPKADLCAPTPPPVSTTNKVSLIDVFWAMVNDLTGKDKLAKFGQYSLRLVLYHAQNTQKALSDDVVNIKSISKTYELNEKILDLLKNFVQNPRAFARVLVILICSVLHSRLSSVVPALGLYRQLLRFGKSPFRINSLYHKLCTNVYVDKLSGSWRISERFFTKSTLGEVIALYYSVNDELNLLYKLNFLKNPTWKRIAMDHEAYAWYCDSWFALYNSYNSLQKLSHQEMELKIQIQVKKRSRALSRQLLGGTALLNLNSSLDDDSSLDAHLLKEIYFKKTNAHLDIYKALSDIAFNSYTVFNLKLHFATVQIWMGISASFLSSVKLYREKKRAMTHEQ